MAEIGGKVQLILGSMKKRIMNGEHAEGELLPSIRIMAQAFSVSPGTVHKAMAILAAEGLIQGRVGSGIYVAASRPDVAADPLPNQARPRRKKEQIVESIAKEISEGNWKSGNTIPSIKMLRFRFNTSPLTLRRALRESAEQGHIHQSGRRWIAGPPPTGPTTRSKRVYSLSAGAPTFSARFPRKVRLDFLVAFEKELANHHVLLSANIGPNDPNRPSASFLARKSALGFFLHGYTEDWARSPENSVDILDREMKWASGLGVPVAVFNCGPVLGRFPEFSFKPFRNIYPIGTDGREAGQSAGAFMYRAGHRRLAYLSYSADFWNGLRLQGLQRARKSSKGKLSEVVPFQAGFDKRNLERSEGVNLERMQKPLMKMAKEISPSWGEICNPPWRQINAPIYDMIVTEHQRIRMEPLFKQALEDRSLTAWVASDPSVARAAAKFLRSNGLSVPGDISLISVDDDNELGFAGITSVDLQRERLAYLAAHCLLGDIPIGRNRKGVVVCPSRIIDRGSVGRVTQ